MARRRAEAPQDPLPRDFGAAGADPTVRTALSVVCPNPTQRRKRKCRVCKKSYMVAAGGLRRNSSGQVVVEEDPDAPRPNRNTCGAAACDETYRKRLVRDASGD